MNISVSFKIAKMLKEKGFNETCNEIYAYGRENIAIENLTKLDNNNDRGYLLAPTIAEVVMWLYKKHEFWICISCDCGNDNLFYSKIFSTEIGGERCVKTIKNINSPTEAYEAAIEYILNNLI